MDAKRRLKHGNDFPYDAPDAWWAYAKPPAIPATDAAHSAARGVIAELQDRRGIKHGFNDIDEGIRKEIVETLAAIIREAFAGSAT